eukprot:scaffold627_cov125-Cylindrotheca_fusiformis.AAC.19
MNCGAYSDRGFSVVYYVFKYPMDANGYEGTKKESYPIYTICCGAVQHMAPYHIEGAGGQRATEYSMAPTKTRAAMLHSMID